MVLNTRTIRRKIRTVENVKKITSAMQLVAGARLRRLQTRVASGRLYAEKIRDITQRVVAALPAVSHPLLAPRDKSGAICLCLAGGARGLCGSYNPQLFRKAEEFLASQETQVAVVTFGRKARQFARRRGLSLSASYDNISGEAPQPDIARVARELRRRYQQGEWDELWLAYTRFVSPARHPTTTVRLLPITPPQGDIGGPLYIFEPSPQALIDWMLPRYFETQFYQALLEASTAEEAVRVIAMKIATDNAEEMLERLERSYHKSRQAAITKELLEVIAAGEALRFAGV